MTIFLNTGTSRYYNIARFSNKPKPTPVTTAAIFEERVLWVIRHQVCIIGY